MRGYGLRGMRERADQLHGYMHLNAVRRTAARAWKSVYLSTAVRRPSPRRPARPVQQG
ncbi:MAG: hypothetical protein R3A10_07175 [Caldilineaceae bacterium]